MNTTTDKNPALAAITITKEDEFEHSMPPASRSVIIISLAVFHPHVNNLI